MKITAEEFNKEYPIGTKVLYFPVYGCQKYKMAKTTSKAWVLGDGTSVVKLNIGAGGYILRNIEILKECSDTERKSVKLEIHSADFEENTLTLQLPEGFWRRHGGLIPGFIKVDITDGLIEKYKKPAE